jgi:hypothetical protein
LQNEKLRLQGQNLPTAAEADESKVARNFLWEQARRQFDRAMNKYGPMWPNCRGAAAGSVGQIDARRPPVRTELSRAIALMCLGSASEGLIPPAAPSRPPASGEDTERPSSPKSPKRCDDLYSFVVELCDSNRQFDRDELERLMFASRLLIKRNDGELDKFTKLELNDRLHQFCQSSLRVSGADPGVLAYLRPYYDAVFEAKMELQPLGVKELVEVVWEATTGDLNPPQYSGEPTLVMYFLNDRCHLILDVPNGRSGRYEIDPIEIHVVDDFSQARKDKRVFACPDALRKSLRSIKLAEGGKFWVHYRDPVQGIGVHRAMKAVISQADPKIEGSAEGAVATEIDDFPFDVKSSLMYPNYSISRLEPAKDSEVAGVPSQPARSRREDAPMARRAP